MSAVKFQCPPFKLFEPQPGYHPQKPIIVGLDDRLESPETATLRYEEAVRAEQGGDPMGDSPPRFPEMAGYGKASLPPLSGYDAPRYDEQTYDQYSQSPYSAASVDKYAQLNQQSFASNHAAVAGYMGPSISLVSCQPLSGASGTKVVLKVSATYELLPLTAQLPYVSVLVGSQKCAARDFARESSDASVFLYSCSVEMPQLMVTGCEGGNVPLSLLIQGASGEEVSRTALGTFQYMDEPVGVVTGQVKYARHDRASPGVQSDQASPLSRPEEPGALPVGGGATNSFDYPAQAASYAPPYHSSDMITAYRAQTFTEPGLHARRPAPSPWAGYGPSGTGRGAHFDHAYAGRPIVTTTLPVPSSTGVASPGSSQLIRTSTLNGGAGGAMPSSKAEIHFNAPLDSMTRNWTREELNERRRIVTFSRTIRGGVIHAHFKPVSPSERDPARICISCILYDDKYWVTSVDAISLLEQLVTSPGSKFTVEEKNRIRRNLEGFGPKTVAKAKDTDEFFRLIMGFPPPRPRNIEKDVKVFPWRSLEQALKKIIGKYTSCSSSSVPPGSSLTQQSHPPPPPPPPSTGSYAALPTPPAQTLPSQHAEHANPYSLPPSHHDPVPSPRSLASSGTQWPGYSSAAPTYAANSARALSPNLRHASPQQQQQQQPLRITTAAPFGGLTGYDNRTVSGGGYGGTGLHTPVSHHPSTATPPRWEGGPVSYGETYSAVPSHQMHGQHPMYTTSSYGDGATRA